MKKLLFCSTLILLIACSKNEQPSPPTPPTPTTKELQWEVLMSDLTISEKKGDYYAMINSNYSWEIVTENTDGWVTLSKNKGNEGLDKVKIAILSNNNSTSRGGKLTFKSKDQTKVFHINQDGVNTNWSSKQFYKIPLVMRFTATWCGYCPIMASTIENVFKLTGGKINIINIHALNSNSQLSYANANLFQSKYNINGYPSGLLDFRASVGNFPINIASPIWQSLINESQNKYPSATAIAVTSTLNGSKVDLEINIRSKETGNYLLNVALIEDDITLPQSDYSSGTNNNYKHNNILRESYLSIDGEQFSINNNQEYTKNLVIGIPSTVKDITKCKVIVYVLKKYGAVISNSVPQATYLNTLEYYCDNSVELEIANSISHRYN